MPALVPERDRRSVSTSVMMCQYSSILQAISNIFLNIHQYFLSNLEMRDSAPSPRQSVRPGQPWARHAKEELLLLQGNFKSFDAVCQCKLLRVTAPESPPPD